MEKHPVLLRMFRNLAESNPYQVLVIDKARLAQRRGQLDETGLELLDLGLTLVFALS